jgi:hypothetical protein
VSLATLAADLRFAWGQNSPIHGEFMGFRELPRFRRLSCADAKVRDTGIELLAHSITSIVYSPFMTENRRELSTTVGFVRHRKPLRHND